MVIVSAHANSALIDWDGFSAGDNLAVKDTETGYIWLDLSQTAGLSFETASDLFSDFSVARSEEVEQLLLHAFPEYAHDDSGIGHSNKFMNRCANTSVCYSAAQTWQSLFGSVVGHRFYQTHSFGLYQDNDGILRMAGSYLNGSGSANFYGSEFTANYNELLAEGSALYSTFLVKKSSNSEPGPGIMAIPAPSSALLLFIALGCLMFHIRVSKEPTRLD